MKLPNGSTHHLAGPALARARVENMSKYLWTEAVCRAKKHCFARGQHRNAQKLCRG